MTFHAYLPPWLLGAIEEAGEATVILKAGDRPYVIKGDSPYHLGSAPITELALEAIAQQILSDAAQEMLYAEGSVEVTLERQRIPVAVRAERLDNELVIRLRNPAAAAATAPEPVATSGPLDAPEPAPIASAPPRDLDIEVDIDLDPDGDDAYAGLSPHADESGLDDDRRQLIAALREAASSEDIRTIIGQLASKLDVPAAAAPRASGNGSVGTTPSDAGLNTVAAKEAVHEEPRPEQAIEEPVDEQRHDGPAHEEPVRHEPLVAKAVQEEVIGEAFEAIPEVETPQVLSTLKMAPPSDPVTKPSVWPDLSSALATSTAPVSIEGAESEPVSDVASPEPFFPDPVPVVRPAAPAPSTLIVRRGQVPDAARRAPAEPTAKRSIFARLASKIGLTRDAGKTTPPVDVRQADKPSASIPAEIEEPKSHQPVQSESVAAQSPSVRPPDPRDVPTSVGRFYDRSLAQLRATPPPPPSAAEVSSPVEHTSATTTPGPMAAEATVSTASEIPALVTAARLAETADAIIDDEPVPVPEFASDFTPAIEEVASEFAAPYELSVVTEEVTPELVVDEPADASEPIVMADVILAPEAAIIEQAAPEFAELSEFAALAGGPAAPELTIVSEPAIVEQAPPDFAELSELSVTGADAIAPDFIVASTPTEDSESVAIGEESVAEVGELRVVADEPHATEDVAAVESSEIEPVAAPELTISPEPAILEEPASEFVELSVVVDDTVTPELVAAFESSAAVEPVATAEAATTPEPVAPGESYPAIDAPVAFDITATPELVDTHEPEPIVIAEPDALQELDAPAETVAAFELTSPPESIAETDPVVVLEEAAPDFVELPSLSFVDEEPAPQELTEAAALEPMVADSARAFELDEPAEDVPAFAAVSDQRAFAEQTSLQEVAAAGERFLAAERTEPETMTAPGFMAKLVSRIGFSRNPEVALPPAELGRHFESVVGRALNDSRHEVPEPESTDAPASMDIPEPEVVTDPVALNDATPPLEAVALNPDAAMPAVDPSPEPSMVTEYDAAPEPVAPPELTAVNESVMAPELAPTPEPIAISEPIVQPEASSAALVDEAVLSLPMSDLPVAADEPVFASQADAHAPEPMDDAEQVAVSGNPEPMMALEPAVSEAPQGDAPEADQLERDEWLEPMEHVVEQERPKAVATVVDLGRRRGISTAAASLGDWIAEAMERRASALYLRVGSPPFARIDGQVEALACDIVPISMFERAGAMLAAGKDGWRKGSDGEWINYAAAMGAIVRCQVFVDEKGGGFIVRLPVAVASSLEHRVPRHVRAACETGDGLIVLSAPFAEDVTAMVTAVAAWTVSRHAGYVVAFGTDGALESVARNAFVSERPAPAGHHEMSVAIQAALHERPDVVIVNANAGRIWSADSIIRAAVGRLVIVGLVARTAPRSMEALLSDLGHAQARQALASVFRAACSWRGFRRSTGKMVLSDVLIGTEHVAALIEEGNIAGLQQAQRNHEGGMRTLDAALGRAVSRRKITLREAAAAAVDRSELVSLVLRQARERRAAERGVESETQRARPGTGV